MFASYASTAEASCSAIAGDVLKLIIRRVLSETRLFFARRLNGIVVGIYVAFVGRDRIICAILVHILCARDAQKKLILSVSEKIKVCVESARGL